MIPIIAVRFLSHVLMAAVLAVCCAACIAQQPPATFKSTAARDYINDDAAILSQPQGDEIFRLLDDHNSKGPGRILLLTIVELPPNTSIEKYAFAKALEGLAGPYAYAESNQIFVVIALRDRKMRIEVSPDVSILVPDEFCKWVIDEVMVPKFKQAQYFEGIRAGIVSLIDRLRRGTNTSVHAAFAPAALRR